MGKDTKRFVKGVVSGWAFMIVSLAVSIWLVPFTLKYLTKPEYAVFAIASDLLSWLSLASLGVGSVLNSKGGQLMGSGGKEELNILTSTTFFTQLGSSLIIVIAGIVVTLKPELLFSKDASAEYMQLVVAILVTGYVISFIFQPLNALLIASKQVHVDNYLKFGLLAIRTILTVFFLVNGMKLLSLALSSFAATLFISVITWIRVKKTLHHIKIDIRLWRYDRFIFLIKNGFWFTLGGLAGIFIFRMDSFLIGQYISLTTVTGFVITIKLYQIADSFHQQFFNTTRPYFAQVYGKGDMPLLSKMYNVTFSLSFASAFVMGIVILLLNKWFLNLWVGPGFYLGDTVNMLLCINFILQAAVLPNRIILATTLYKIELHSLTRILEGSAKIGIALLVLAKFGVPALIISGIVSSVLFSNCGLNLISAKLLNESFFIKVMPFLLLIPIPFINSLTNPSLRIVSYLLLATLVILWLMKKLLKNHDFLVPFFSQITGRKTERDQVFRKDDKS
jgi:O-antigen/teichoic acid export membrane protein